MSTAKAKPELKHPAVLSFINYKGGVGKTNVAVNFAYYCASECGLKTLLIDWDPQGDATEYVGVGRENVRVTMFDILAHEQDPAIGENITHTNHENLYLIGANASLKNVENLIAKNDASFDIFRETVLKAAELFDVVIVDCPPANSHVNLASLFASTEVFVVTTDVSDSLDKIDLVHSMVGNICSIMRENLSDDEIAQARLPKIAGIILTMVTKNTVGLDVAINHLRTVWPDMLIEPAVHRTVTAGYSVSENTPLLKGHSNDKISQKYREVFEEVLHRVTK